MARDECPPHSLRVGVFLRSGRLSLIYARAAQSAILGIGLFEITFPSGAPCVIQTLLVTGIR